MNNRPKVLVTAGPTVEDIDPVRYLTNRSTGRMGIEVARALLEAGAQPFLVLGPTAAPVPDGIETLRVRSAADMAQAVVKHFADADALVMAAAVADYTPAEPLDAKLKKQDGDLLLRLKRTVDILAGLKDAPGRANKFVVGFSLDVDVNMDEGRRKLKAKNLDCIVVNGVSSFGSDRETAVIIDAASTEDCGEITKTRLAGKIVGRILDWFGGGAAIRS